MLAISILSVASGSTATIFEYVGGIFTDVSPFILLAIGLPIGFWVIRKAISLVRAR
jgi:hypothetical protein